MTNLEYLKDTYLFEDKASIVYKGSNEFGKYIILDKTIFYPQGGGQPSDTGAISNKNGVFLVSSVRLNSEGIVYHYGVFKSGNFSENKNIDLKIDKNKRIINAKNHSAGHLIDIAINNLGIQNIIPTKGFHFPEGCYVEYSGKLDLEKIELIKKLNIELENLINQKINILINNNSNSSIKAPDGKKVRVISFEGYKGCGCGGTHINNSSEIGGITIRKIKEKKGVIRVSYSVN